MKTESARQSLYALLGRLPHPTGQPSSRCIVEKEFGTYILEHLILDLGDLVPVPAYFIRPKHAQAPYPAALYCHSHGGFYESGKKEFIQGQAYLCNPPYAEQLARLGFAGLCIDQWCFGERRGDVGLISESAAAKYFLWKGSCLWGMMVYDSLRALEYLRSRSDVDSERIVSIGMSMGASLSIWTAALDPELRACIDICGQVDGESLIEAGGLDRHGIYYYVPALLEHFSMADIDALIAPRPHLAIAGDRDALTPTSGLDRIGRLVAASYAEAGAPEAWRLERLNCGHEETAEARALVIDFLRSL
jgi:dienelactone hydrolase